MADDRTIDQPTPALLPAEETAPPARLKLTPHPDRGAVLGEVHARPFQPVAVPARLLHFAFRTDLAAADADRAALTKFCLDRGAIPPKPGARHHVARFGRTVLRWEQHSEFITYSWEVGAGTGAPFEVSATMLAQPMADLPQPGPHLVSVDLVIAPYRADFDFEGLFDPASLCVCEVDQHSAVVATDLAPGADGFIRYLVLAKEMGEDRAGALTQRLLELETYRVMALLALPKAQRLAPGVRRIEVELATITQEMTKSDGLAANHRLLDQLTALAAKLEAEASATAYRFGASRAYQVIMEERLKVLGETPMQGHLTLGAFLSRRHAPAMRTCNAIEERQFNLSSKLSRATQLLRTRVDVEIEQQNRDVLVAMNERTHLQLRLQQTVEGLSVAAITYYIVGLVSYVAKAWHDLGYPGEPTVIAAASVPIALLAVAYTVRRIRHIAVADKDAKE